VLDVPALATFVFVPQHPTREEGQRLCVECMRRMREYTTRAVVEAHPGKTTVEALESANNAAFLAQVEATLPPSGDPAVLLHRHDVITQVWLAVAPRDGLERAIVTQLLIAHFHAVACFGAATRGMGLDVQGEALRLASRVQRTFATLIDGLDRHRGAHRVVVEHKHVTVQQAIVGPLSLSVEKSRDQPHAITHAPGIPMPSPNAESDTLSSVGDAERQMPHARRRINGSAAGE
jgi:hypothetical protein